MKLVLYVVFIIVITVVAQLTTSIVRNRVSVGNEVFEVNEEYTHTLKKVHLIETMRDKKEWELHASVAHSSKKNADWIMSDVDVIFFDDFDKPIKVRGSKARFQSQTRMLVISGNVVASINNGYEIKSEELVYNSNTRLLESQGAVEIERSSIKDKSKSIIQSGSMKTSMRDQVMMLEQNVKATRGSKAQGGIEIESGQARLSRSSRSVEFFDKITMNWGENYFSGDEGRFIYDTKSDQLSDIWIIGNVQFRGSSRSGRCEKAHLNISEAMTIFMGNPQIIDDGHKIEGESIALDHERDSLSIKQIKGEFLDKGK